MRPAYKDFADLTGRYYGLLSEYECEDAETVFVSLGSAAENIEAAVDYLRETRGASVGSIHVNVIRPFPEAAIVKALKGKKNVIILERTDEGMSRRQSAGPRHSHGAEQGCAGRDALRWQAGVRRGSGDRGARDAAHLLRHLRPWLARLPSRAHHCRI